MPTIGIIGAENSHTVAIAKTINIDQLVSGFSVTHVWGETPGDAKDAQERGLIPNIVQDPEDLIGEVDAAIVDHRHPKYHLPAVRPLLEAKIPLFVDKPFCYRLDEGKEFLARARELSVPVCSFSVLPKQASFAQLQEDVRELGRIISVVSTGPCDIDSEYGGVFLWDSSGRYGRASARSGYYACAAQSRATKSHCDALFCEWRNFNDESRWRRARGFPRFCDWGKGAR